MIKEDISYDFMNDMHFAELKEVEILKERLGILGDVDNYVGKYFSQAWVRKHVLRQTEDEIEELDKEMEEENADGEDDASEIPEIPQQQAPAPQPQELVINVKKEEKERVVPDVDQVELAKSMTKFFDTLVEEAKGDKE
jgi:seryl-tRNA synthetase